MVGMLEKAARAAEEADMTWAFNPDGDRFEQIARATLLAVRWPGYELGIVGAGSILENRERCPHIQATDSFAAIVDAILAQPSEGEG